jgi:hypothetical protein
MDLSAVITRGFATGRFAQLSRVLARHRDADRAAGRDANRAAS